MSSVLMKVMTLVLRFEKARAARRTTPKVEVAAEVPASLKKACQVIETDFEGIPTFEIIPRTVREPAKTLIYLHGGGYVSPILTAHWWLIHRLAVENGIRVLVPFYGLAPAGTHRDAYPRMIRYYEKILTSTRPENIYVGGDSAGGGFTLALAEQLRDAGLPLPAHLFLLSPWLDVTMANPNIGELATKDPMLDLDRLQFAGKAWAGPDSPDIAAVSPIYGDLTGLPPMEVIIGTNDMFIADCRKLGTLTPQATVREYPGAFHVFIAVTLLPESRHARATLSQIITGTD
jgi:acetyl esterase/lipase